MPFSGGDGRCGGWALPSGASREAAKPHMRPAANWLASRNHPAFTLPSMAKPTLPTMKAGEEPIQHTRSTEASRGLTLRAAEANPPKSPQNSAAGARRLRMPNARATGMKGMPKKDASGLCSSSSHKTRKGNREGITVSQHSCMPRAAPCMAMPGRASVCTMHKMRNRNHAARRLRPFCHGELITPPPFRYI